MSRLRATRSERSAWSRAPLRGDANAARGGKGDILGRAARLGDAALGALDPVAGRLGASVRAGLGRVGAALEDPTPDMPAELLRQTDLPELEGEAALVSLALRLDREADMWRGVAFRQLGRAAWAGRLSVTGAGAALVGELALAAIGGFRALVGGGLTGAPPLLLGVSAAILALGAVTAGWVLERARRSQLDVARGALARADLAEARLHRIAAMLELRAVAPDRYVDALTLLERDTRDCG